MAAGQTIDGISVLDTCIHPLAVFLVHKRCCGSSIAGTATATCEPARDLNSVLIVFPESSVNTPNAHSIRIDSERFQIQGECRLLDQTISC